MGGGSKSMIKIVVHVDGDDNKRSYGSNIMLTLRKRNFKIAYNIQVFI